MHWHCLIPGGVLSDQQQWHPAKSTYLFPVRVLSRLFRGKMVSRLREAAEDQQLTRVTNVGKVPRILKQLMNKEWVVYGKPCLHKAETVVQYLSRYTRALSESRLLGMDDTQVRFCYQDYRDGQSKVMALDGAEFLRRFLQHVLPSGFMRIRHFGWWVNACRRKRLPEVRAAIAVYQGKRNFPDTVANSAPLPTFEGISCPGCEVGLMRVRYPLPPTRLEYG